MLCSSHSMANCQTVSNNDVGNDNNYINETSVGLSFTNGASSRGKPINDSDIAFYGISTNNWTDLFSATAGPANGTVAPTAVGGGFGAEVMIPLYSIIFILSVLGNILVIVTLTQNRRMRTVTNVFLLNLVSVSTFQ